MREPVQVPAAMPLHHRANPSQCSLEPKWLRTYIHTRICTRIKYTQTVGPERDTPFGIFVDGIVG